MLLSEWAIPTQAPASVHDSVASAGVRVHTRTSAERLQIARKLGFLFRLGPVGYAP